jgi:hypothetical protein
MRARPPAPRPQPDAADVADATSNAQLRHRVAQLDGENARLRAQLREAGVTGIAPTRHQLSEADRLQLLHEGVLRIGTDERVSLNQARQLWPWTSWDGAGRLAQRRADEHDAAAAATADEAPTPARGRRALSPGHPATP